MSRTKQLIALLAVALAITPASGGTVIAAPPEKITVIIQFDRRPEVSEESLVRGFGGDIKYRYRIVPAIAASIPALAVQGLRRNPRVVGVEQNIVFQATEEYPWGVSQVGADAVHGTGDNGSAVRIAVIDTGIDYTHPDLAAAYDGGYDFVNGDDDPMDDNGHGTHVAGTIAAALNGQGVIGVAPGAKLYALKILDRHGSGNLYDVISALDWACGNNPRGIVVRITNNSYGSPVDDPLGLLRQAFDYSYHNDDGDEWNLLHVASAGNEGTADTTENNVGYPAAYDSVVAVAATDQGNSRAWFSSTGPDVEIAAPGVAILSTYLNNSYVSLSGTSMASPHVAGTAALVMYAHPDWSNTRVRQQLQVTADDLGSPGRDGVYGFGLVDAYEAVVAGVPAKLAFNTQPSAGNPANVRFATQPVVAILDSLNNVVTTATNNVTLAITPGTGTPGAVLYGSTAVTAVNGLATFSGLSIDKPGVGYALTATSANLTSTVSNSFAVGGTTVADFDADGKRDLAVYNPANGDWFIWQSFTSTLRQQNWGWSGATAVPGDYDGDGKTDLAVYNPANGDWFIWQSFTSTLRQQNWGWSGATAVPGDYDGDGKTDLAVYNPANGDWFIWQSFTSTLRQQNWGWSGATAVPGDYDGDGKTDLAVYNPANGDWFIWQSFTSTLRQQNWGWSGATAVPGDYDGDGKTDLAVYNPANGDWFIWQSFTSTLRQQNWGWSGATAVPGDYDGDGKTDLAVYNPANGDWFIWQSFTSTLRQQNWGWSGAIPVP